MKTNRRDFLQTAALAAATASLGGFSIASREGDSPAARGGGKGMSILILGGTGFLGPAIVEEAVRRGHKLTLFNRGKTNPDLFPDLEWLKGDRHGDIEALHGRKWDAVIDTSGYVPSHVDATASLLSGNTGQYVFLSSISVYADNTGPGTEQTPVIELTDEVVATMKTIRESLQHYGGMKARCEMAAEAAMPGRVTNIRPGLIVGPMDRSDRFTYWPVRIRRGGEVMAPGDGTDPVQYIDVRDLGNWVLDCIENKTVGVFNAVTPAGRFNMAELLHGIKSAFTTDAVFTWVDAAFLQAQGINPWSHMPVWIPAQGEYAGFHLHSSEKAVEAGLEFRPLAQTALDTLDWFQKARPADYEFGKTAGISRKREAEVLEAWRAHLAAGEEKEAGEEGD